MLAVIILVAVILIISLGFNIKNWVAKNYQKGYNAGYDTGKMDFFKSEIAQFIQYGQVVWYVPINAQNQVDFNSTTTKQVILIPKIVGQ